MLETVQNIRDMAEEGDQTCKEEGMAFMLRQSLQLHISFPQFLGRRVRERKKMWAVLEIRAEYLPGTWANGNEEEAHGEEEQESMSEPL